MRPNTASAMLHALLLEHSQLLAALSAAHTALTTGKNQDVVATTIAQILEELSCGGEISDEL